MIGITKLLCGTASTGDALRYERQTSRLPSHLLQFSLDKRPVVVWNVTRRCNLHCRHCYFGSQDKEYPEELTTQEGLAFIDSLAQFGVPVILFSGGEPLLREDLPILVGHAARRGIRAVISTNGTLITPSLAREMREVGVSYVGVSLDGLERVHDRFRGKQGAFQASLQGIRYCREAGVKMGLRFTITRANQGELPGLFDLAVEEDIPRLCVYHLAYVGRGSHLIEEDLSHEETRRGMELICQRTRELHQQGRSKEVLTVDNHADGVYVYLKVLAEEPERASEVYQLLRWNGGNSSGVGIAAVDNLGNVHADQFWGHYSFGNVREKPFPEIWQDTSDPLMNGLKNKKAMVKGRCARCRYLEVCGGNLRVRAEAVYGDVWAEDPACYLTEAEIGFVA
ncbi:MAG: radical SAM protein [Chloroflexi bacterium]|nr:radical SAM protein [Chloroflexota bacterium]